tara:strand:+ start:1979 stop:2230 length:252 start_codon:yes stop_codon:yes gene_type:complete
MSVFREIEHEVECWIAESGPSYYGADNKTEAWEDEIDNFVNEVASEIYEDLDAMIDDWCERHLRDRVNTWIDTLPENEEEDET